MSSDPKTTRRWPWAAALLLVLVVGLAARIGFARLVTDQQPTSQKFFELQGDTREYVHLGEVIYQSRATEYVRADKAISHYRGLIRPPGYPLLYAAMRWLGIDLDADLRPIVWPQAVIGSLGPLAAFWIGALVFRSLAGATIVGLMSSLAPSGVAACAIAMPDAIYAVCFAVSFGCMLQLCRNRPQVRGGLWIALLGGFALAASVLLKPASMYWPVLAVPIVIRWGGGVRSRRAWLLAFAYTAPMVACVAGWSTRNYLTDGLATYSTISTRNLRYFVVPEVELTARLGRTPTPDEVLAEYVDITRRQRDYLYDAPDGDAAVLHREHQREVRAALHSHPLATARVLARNLASQMTARWKKVMQQLPGRRGEWSARIRDAYDRTDSPLALWLWYVPMIAGLPLAWWAGDRGAVRMLGLCALAYVYVVLPTATVPNEGSRLLLAAEPMSIALWVAGVWYAGALGIRPSRRRPADPETPARVR